MSTAPKKGSSLPHRTQHRNHVQILESPLSYIFSPLDDGDRPIRFCTCAVRGQLSVILSLDDWELLIQLYEELEKVQLAMGKGFMPIQPLQIANHLTVKGRSLVVLPANAWERLAYQIENFTNAADWDGFTNELTQLEQPAAQLEQPTPSPRQLHEGNLPTKDTFMAEEQSEDQTVIDVYPV
jgi:hypothetical protein